MLESGIRNLDRILGGGIPEGDVVLITGPAGSGKTTLSFQIAFQQASSTRNVVYVSTLSETPARLVRHLRSFSFYDESQIGKYLILLQIFPIIKEGLEQTIEALIAAATEHRASLLIIDGLDTVRDIHGGTVAIRSFIYDLAVALSALECTTIITSTDRREQAGQASPELTMSDSIIVLDQADLGNQNVRTIRLQKVRGHDPLLGVHGMRIDRDGVAVIPRIESLTGPSAAGLSQERVPVGHGELDRMMSGGLLRGSVTLLAGAPGTGKTLMGLQYILAGAQLGERGLIVTLRESPRLLIDKVRGFGMDLETPIKQGLVSIRRRAPIDLLADEILDEVLCEIESFAPRRLVMDSVTEIEHAVADERRRRSALTCFAELIRAHEVTALVTREMGQLAGPELDFSDSPLAMLGENLLLLRYVEFRGELHRILSILKMRDSVYDRTIRQYKIGGHGLEVLAAMNSAEGLLTGIARLPSEMRVKRSGSRGTGEG